MEVVINVVRAIKAAQQTIPRYGLVHTGASCPSTNISFKQRHANIGLTLSKHRGKNLIPISRKGELERDIQFKGLENLGFDFKLDIISDL